MKIHSSIRKTLSYPKSISDNEIISDWKDRTSKLCKPCWELKYCPYGYLVEQFPMIPDTLGPALEHQVYLKKCLKQGKFEDGSKLRVVQIHWFRNMVNGFRKKSFPDRIPKFIDEASCKIFGHLCPVFFAAEGFTETRQLRQHSRSIPREVMLKVVRRDGQICQRCFKAVPDDKIEFDHIIPFSKGGTSKAENLRLICRDCNRKKSNSLREILSDDPVFRRNEKDSK
jgi:hypothetical protein